MDTALVLSIAMLTQATLRANVSRTPPALTFNTIHGITVHADISQALPTLAANMKHGIPVGADLSCAPPIYRPTAHNTIASFPRIHRSSSPLEGNP
jgi:hypothetical protein